LLPELSGKRIRQLYEALLSAFPSEPALRQLVRFELNQNLRFIVSNSGSLETIALDLIEWVTAHGKLEQLIRGALDTNPDNPQLRMVATQLGILSENVSRSIDKTPDVPVVRAQPDRAQAPDLITKESSYSTLPVSSTPDRIAVEDSENKAQENVTVTSSTANTTTFVNWRALFNDLESGQCTPILGPGLIEPLLGESREMARRWAQTYRFPMATANQDDLPQVAQFVATMEKANTVRLEFRKYLTGELQRRYPNVLPETVGSASLDDLLRRVASTRWEQNPNDSYRILAALPFPVYITTNIDNLLGEALKAAGKDPQIELCHWRDDVPWPPSVYDTNLQYQPTVEKPLVYHLFGRLTLPVSLVLKEDDYFDYLVGVTRNSRLVPSVVRAALADSALVFIGFQMDDWGFRVLFRSIIGQGAPARRGDYTHVAVQLDPDAKRVAEIEGARRYLQNYFQTADVSIYWGPVERFLSEFQREWTRYQTSAGTPG